MDTRLKEYSEQMEKAFEVLQREFNGLRTGRASLNLLDPIKVDAYGSMTPLPQIASINAPEARLLSVQVWDKNLVKVAEKAIRDAGLGLNPSAEGHVIRVPLPPLSQERRQEFVKVAGKYAEEARISVRNVRREGMEKLKKLERDKAISEDEYHKLAESMQELTDQHIKKIDDTLSHKQKDIMQL